METIAVNLLLYWFIYVMAYMVFYTYLIRIIINHIICFPLFSLIFTLYLNVTENRKNLGLG